MISGDISYGIGLGYNAEPTQKNSWVPASTFVIKADLRLLKHFRLHATLQHSLYCRIIEFQPNRMILGLKSL